MCKKPRQTGLEALPFFTATRGGKNSHTWEKNFPHVAAKNKFADSVALQCCSSEYRYPYTLNITLYLYI